VAPRDQPRGKIENVPLLPADHRREELRKE
jgi:hypothetical protein